MQSPLSYLKVRAVRLGIMAAFVLTFIGIPSLGYQYNIDSFQKFDAFHLGDNVLNYGTMAGEEEQSNLRWIENLTPRGDKAVSAAQVLPEDPTLVENLRNFFSSVFSF